MKTILIKITKDVGFVETRLVKVNENLGKDDLYLSTSGHYEKCPCPGLKYNGGINWYRPI